MKYYNSIQKVQVDQEAVEKALKFAKSVVSTTNYSDSHQESIEKITNDHFISKIGEEAVRIVFSRYTQVQGPDYAIYHGKLKSWDDDLYINNAGLAVKTQKKSTADRFGLSWTFQCGFFRRDTILDNPEAWVVFVKYYDDKPHVCEVFPPFQMKELILGEPKLLKLKGSKKVVYADTFPKT